MEDIFYTHQKFIQKTSLESRPEEKLGFNYDTYVDLKELGDSNRSESGLVSIDNLITSLEKMKSNGCNYVSCDWHCDHVELDLYGFEYRLATDDEVKIYHIKKQKEKSMKREEEILRLESRLQFLKNLQNKE
jgi:hypothetical protein